MKLKIEINCADDCMSIREINRILFTLSDRLKIHSKKYPKTIKSSGNLLTIDGNSCGSFEFEPE